MIGKVAKGATHSRHIVNQYILAVADDLAAERWSRDHPFHCVGAGVIHLRCLDDFQIQLPPRRERQQHRECLRNRVIAKGFPCVRRDKYVVSWPLSRTSFGENLLDDWCPNRSDKANCSIRIAGFCRLIVWMLFQWAIVSPEKKRYVNIFGEAEFSVRRSACRTLAKDGGCSCLAGRQFVCRFGRRSHTTSIQRQSKWRAARSTRP